MSRHKCDKAKQVDRGCRNNGPCPHCRGNRTYQGRKAEQAADEQMKEHCCGKEKEEADS